MLFLFCYSFWIEFDQYYFQRWADTFYSGAGTGIFTSNLLASPNASTKIKQLTAIEPSSGMQKSFNSNKAIHESEAVKNGATKVSIVDGAFAEIPLKDGAADIIVGEQFYSASVSHDRSRRVPFYSFY